MVSAKVLVVDDDKSLRIALAETLALAGYEVVQAATAQDALAALYTQRDFNMVLSDINMSPMDGMALLISIREAGLSVPVMLMTAYGSVEQAVNAMRHGAVDYLVKPFEAGDLLDKVERIISGLTQIEGLVFGDDRMKEVVALASRVADSDATVMISGASGAGKEVMAHYIHSQSSRCDKPFIAINCAAIPENMLESTLFGYEKGAYTGAHKATPGKFELAQGGTLLLDEISEMELGLQAKLLRVLQEKEVERLGGKTVIPLDVRVLATTNRNLRDEVSAGRFREDLFYRLNVFPMRLPSLRQRKGDVEPIADALLRKHTPKGVMPKMFSEAALEKLINYDWPGNVRELENVVQRALILSDGPEISARAIHFEQEEEPQSAPAVGSGQWCLEDDLRSREADMIIEMLKTCNGSRKMAAERLGISPRTLRYKLSRLREQGIEVPEAANGMNTTSA